MVNFYLQIQAEYGKWRIEIVVLDGSFSRGLGLQEGMRNMQDDDLVYFCDIDLVMTSEILDRIRRNTIQGKQVKSCKYTIHIIDRFLLRFTFLYF